MTNAQCPTDAIIREVHGRGASTAAPTTTSTAASTTLSPALTWLLACGTGLAVASIYYSQPMLGLLREQWQVSERVIGWLPILTQLGYALGLLLLAPLGDRHDRRHIIAVKAAVLSLALAGAAVAPSIGWLMAASLVLGLAATLAQDIVPAAATLAPEARRGKVIGQVMTGLLLGILLSRTVSGLVTEHGGWRRMFGLASLVVALLGLALWRGLPSFAPTTRAPYRQLLGSLAGLWSAHRSLRTAALAQGLLALGFSAFWSTLAVMLHREPFHLGPAASGLFGLIGAAGALAAPVAGRLADRRGPAPVARWGAGLTAASFALMLAFPWLPVDARLWLLGVGAVGFDFGLHMAMVAHQTLVYGIDPAGRSRLNAVLMVGIFTGMTTGATLGSQALAAWGWTGVTLLATGASLLALGVRWLGDRRAA